MLHDRSGSVKENDPSQRAASAPRKFTSPRVSRFHFRSGRGTWPPSASGQRPAGSAPTPPQELDKAIVACWFGGTLINTDAASAHLMHHLQQVNLEPVGGARAL